MRFSGLILLWVLFCTRAAVAQPVFDAVHLNGILMPVQVKDTGEADSLKPAIRNVHAFLQLPIDLPPRNTLILFPYFEHK